MDVKLRRDNALLNVTVAPTMLIGDKPVKQKIIGISPGEKFEIVKSNPFYSVSLAANYVGRFTVLTYRGIWFLITGQVPVKGSVGGPIQIVELLAGAIKHGLVSVLGYVAIISMALAIFNLLPFPILDGGHVLFLGIEKLRRKPVSEKTLGIITQVAFFLLIAFVLYVSYNDITRVISRFGS